MYPRLTVLALLAALPQVFAQDPSSSEESSDESTVDVSTEEVTTSSSDESTVDVSAEDVTTNDMVTTLEATATTTEATTMEGATQGATPEPTDAPTFIALPNPTPVSTTQNTTAFVFESNITCSDCSGQFNTDGDVSEGFFEAFGQSVVASHNGITTGDESVELLELITTVTRHGQMVRAITVISQENMVPGVKSALSEVTKSTFLKDKTAIKNVLPDEATFVVTSLTVTEVADDTPPSPSSSVQTGSALSFLCSLLWLIK